MNGRNLTLAAHPEPFTVCRLAADEPIPSWASTGSFVCITRTRDELSIVCAESLVPLTVRCEAGWRCFQLLGPFAFSEVGILAGVVGPLAEAGISVFAISTFDTDYVLVKIDQEQAAIAAWTAAGLNLAACD